MTSPLPAPKFKYVDLAKKVIDMLVQGVGEEAAIGFVKVQMPLLATPMGDWLLRIVITKLAKYIDGNVFKWGTGIIIRAMYRHDNGQFKNDFKKLLDGPETVTPEELKKIDDDIDKLVYKGDK